MQPDESDGHCALWTRREWVQGLLTQSRQGLLAQCKQGLLADGTMPPAETANSDSLAETIHSGDA